MKSQRNCIFSKCSAMYVRIKRTFHALPKDLAVKEKWKEFLTQQFNLLNEPNWQSLPKSKHIVCSLHFVQSDFHNFYYYMNDEDVNLRLKPEAVPTIPTEFVDVNLWVNSSNKKIKLSNDVPSPISKFLDVPIDLPDAREEVAASQNVDVNLPIKNTHANTSFNRTAVEEKYPPDVKPDISTLPNNFWEFISQNEGSTEPRVKVETEPSEEIGLSYAMSENVPNGLYDSETSVRINCDGLVAAQHLDVKPDISSLNNPSEDSTPIISDIKIKEEFECHSDQLNEINEDNESVNRNDSSFSVKGWCNEQLVQLNEDSIDDISLSSDDGNIYQPAEENLNISSISSSNDQWLDPIEIPFEAIPGLKVDMPADARPVDYLLLFWSDEILEIIVNETNNYAASILSNVTMTSRISRWTPLDIPELKRFLANIIFMGIVRMPSLADYYKNDMYNMPFFKNNMSQRRFELILRCLHFSNNDESVDNSKPYEYNLRKFYSLLNILLQNIRDIYLSEKNVALDESMLLWRGGLSFRQNINTKKHRYGIKFYELSTPGGFMLNMLVHTTEDGFRSLLGESFNEKVVMSLAEPFLDNKGYHLFMDNFYNRASISQRQGSVMVSKWKDKRDILMISTAHKHEMVRVKNMKPAEIRDYNGSMGGAYCCIPRKTIKWYKKVLFYLLDVSILNASILYNMNNVNNKMNLKTFRESIIRSWAKQEEVKSAEQTSSDFHYLQTIPSKCEKRKRVSLRCKNCYKHGRRKETVYQCAACKDNPALCVVDCFKEWHINLHYRTN